ncbi:sigma-70 family RNA polymerase sigma factor [Streptomyces sp. NPDC056696]|uniref:sigma-70 family RNA polymerase sigma factor n=1 Tax=unclassified Streptomyces TaxID=2593676 RepID=UPI0036C7DD9C
MRHQAVGVQAAPITRAALAELLARLRRVAAGGVVPEEVFAAQAQRLGLGDVERERLREELVRLGVPVQKTVAHTNIDRPDVKKVARNREENVHPRLAPVAALLGRYADAEGCVTARALEGVVRLAGLNAREAAALRGAATVRAEEGSTQTTVEVVPVAGHDGSGTVEGARAAGQTMAAENSPAAGQPSAAEALPAAVEFPSTKERNTEEWPDGPGDEPMLEPSEAVVPTGTGLAAAVAAARAVMREDRFRRWPEKYLLTAEEEVGLGVLVRGGCASGMGEEPDQETLNALPPDNIRICARDCLVLHNQRLVRSMIPRYLDQGLDYGDLFQHGVLGLMRAARKFNPAKGFKFSTYATWWIRQSITRAIADEGALIRIPVHMHEQIRKVANAERSLAAQGRPATVADVAVLCDLSLQKVEEARRLSRRTDSLDRVIGDGTTLGDFVGRTRPLASVEDGVLNALLAEDAMAVVNTFTGRDHRVLVRRLGLDGDEPSTLEELGREFGVTRERIRQLEVKLRPELQERLRKARLLGLRAVAPHEKPESTGNGNASAAARAVLAARRARTGRDQPGAGEDQNAGVAASTFAARPPATPPRGEAETVVPAENGSVAEAVREGAVPAVPQQTMPTLEVTAVPDTEAVAASHESAGDFGATADVPDWDRACRLAKAPSGQAWLAEYALAAVGHQGLIVFLGQPEADAVVRIAREREPADLLVLTALEMLRHVFDSVAQAGLGPEDFFDRPVEALCGVTPRSYLASKPLVHGNSRLAVRDALREFVAAERPRPGPVQEREHGEAAMKLDAHPEVGAAVREVPPAGAEEEQPIKVGELPSGETTTGATVGTPQYTADWDRALELTQPPFGGGVAWLADYALLAVGHLELSVLLGSPATGAVVRAARQGAMLNRHVVRALEVLDVVFNAVKELGLRPEHFFERPSEALVGVTPKAYLAARPLVGSESRLAVRDALREFVDVQTARKESVPEVDDVSAPEDPPVDAGEQLAPSSVEAGQPPVHAAAGSAAQTQPAHPPVDVDQLLSEAQAQHESEVARLVREHERRLTEERRVADECLAAAQADTERQLDAQEQELLNRVDRALELREKQLLRRADERVARLEYEHREAILAATRRAEQAEEAASTDADERASRFRARAEAAEQRLRRYREEGEERIAGLEARLRQAESQLIARDRAVYETGQRAAAGVAEAQQRAEAAEQRAAALVTAAKLAEARAADAEKRAAARLAQTEHDAWVRITELQAQLAELQSAAAGRATLRDRWRRP